MAAEHNAFSRLMHPPCFAIGLPDQEVMLYLSLGSCKLSSEL